eukprot:COSAG01_NODE_6084_length_3862_cov_2.626893_1_plen_170_part_00
MMLNFNVMPATIRLALALRQVRQCTRAPPLLISPTKASISIPTFRTPLYIIVHTARGHQPHPAPPARLIRACSTTALATPNLLADASPRPSTPLHHGCKAQARSRRRRRPHHRGIFVRSRTATMMLNFRACSTTALATSNLLADASPRPSTPLHQGCKAQARLALVHAP